MEEPSDTIRERVQAARNIQQRFSNNDSSDMICNADMRVREIRQFCKLQDEGQSLMQEAMPQLNLLVRAYHHTRSAKLARTIADLSGMKISSTLKVTITAFPFALAPHVIC
jgi:magnesium chelatase family protein